jgi:hypothetical protein
MDALLDLSAVIFDLPDFIKWSKFLSVMLLRNIAEFEANLGIWLE